MAYFQICSEVWSSELYHIPHKLQKSLCESLGSQDFGRMWLCGIVSSRRWKNSSFIQMESSRRWKNSSFIHMGSDRVAVGRSVTFINITYVSVLIFHSGWLQSISTFLTKFTFSWWIMNICQHVHVLFVFPNYCCLSPLVLTITSPHFSFIVLLLKLFGILLHFGLTVPP